MDYNKKLEEIQAKYKKALQIDDEPDKTPKPKKSTQNKSNKELPFSMEEFHTLKKQVSLESEKKPQTKSKSKITKVECKSKSMKTKPKTERFDRSTSLKRKKVTVDINSKKHERKNFSRPKTFISSFNEEDNLDSIKNSILKIKEKAFMVDDEQTPKPRADMPKPEDSIAKAQITLSSIDLGTTNPQPKQETAKEALERYNNVVETFSLRASNPPDTSQGNKEPESYHPSRPLLSHISKTPSEVLR